MMVCPPAAFSHILLLFHEENAEQLIARKGLFVKYPKYLRGIDKNSLLGGSNIQKTELCVKGILAQDLVFVLGSFQRGFGGFSG
jgi:hypothetical protein